MVRMIENISYLSNEKLSASGSLRTAPRPQYFPVADLEGAEPAPPPPFGRRTDSVTHGTRDI